MRIKWKFSVIVAVLSIMVLLPQTFYAQTYLSVQVNGKKVQLSRDQQPYLNNKGNTMMPIRGLSDYLGYKVKWDAKKKQVELSYQGKVAILPVNSKTVTVNGKRVTIDAPTEMVGGRVFVPLRFVSQTFGAKVVYDSKNKLISITPQKVTPTPAPTPTPTPAPTPTPTPAPTPTPVNGLTPSHYVVKTGDTLFKIASQYKVDVTTIKELNNLKDDTIKVGQTLRLTANVVYVVQKGDTLYQVAVAHGVTIADIKKENNLTKDSLSIGQVLQIPAKNKETAKPKEEPVLQQATVKVSGGLNVRAGAGTTHKIVGYLSNATVVNVSKIQGKWAQITYGKIEGWVHTDYIVIGVEEEKPVASSDVLKGKIIVLDPGHGGNDSGAVAIGGKVLEKTLALSYAKAMETELKKLGATVYMTRTSDTRCGGVQASTTTVDLQCRVDFAKTKKADIFISVHFNSAYGATGTETFYNETWLNGYKNPYPAESKRLATLVHQNYRPAVNLPDRRVKAANYYVNNRATMPSILLEVGFLSNQTDLSRVQLDTVKNKVAVGVAKGVQEYFAK